jgi:hypothetical protein
MTRLSSLATLLALTLTTGVAHARPAVLADCEGSHAPAAYNETTCALNGDNACFFDSSTGVLNCDFSNFTTCHAQAPRISAYAVNFEDQLR